MTVDGVVVRRRALALLAGLTAAVVTVVPDGSVSAQATAPVLGVTLAPAVIGPGSTTTLELTVDNSADFVAATDLAFSVVLPDGLAVADPPHVADGCGSSVTARAGDTRIAIRNGSVAAGGSCTVGVDVRSSAVATVTVDSSPLTSSAGVTPGASAVLDVTPDLPGIRLAVDAASASPGSRATATFTVDNSLGAVGVSHLELDLSLPTGVVVADPSGAATDCGPAALPSAFSPLRAEPGSDRVEFAGFGSSPSNEVVASAAVCTVSVDVVTPDPGASALRAVATAGVGGTPPVPVGTAGAVLSVDAPAIGVVKEYLDDPILPGASTTVRYTIANHDPAGDASDVVLADPLAGVGLALAAPLPDEPCGAGSTLVAELDLRLERGSLPAGGSCSFEVDVAVPPDAPPGRIVATTGEVTATVTDTTVVGGRASDTLFVVLAPVLTTEFVDDPQGAGGSVTLAYRVDNPDPTAPMTAIAFEHRLVPALASASLVAGTPAPPPPAGLAVRNVCGAGSTLEYTPLLPAGAGSGALLRLSGGAVEAGASCSFEVVLDVAANAATGLHPSTTSPVTAAFLGARVTGGDAGDTLAVVGAPVLRATLGADLVEPGGAVAVEYSIMNGRELESVGPATDVSFVHDLGPAPGLVAVPPLPLEPCGPGSALTVSSGGTVVGLAGGSLAQDESCRFTVLLQLPPDGPQGSFPIPTGALSATAAGVPVVGVGADADLLVARLGATATFVDDPVLPGAPVTLRYQVVDGSPLDLTGIVIADDPAATLPGLTGGSVLANDCGGAVGTSPVVSLDSGSLAAGAACTFEVQLAVPADASPGEYAHEPAPIGATVGGRPVVLPVVAEPLQVVAPPTVGLAVEFLGDAHPGGVATARYTLSNPSGVAVSGLGFGSDLTPTLAGLTVVAGPDTACGGAVQATPGTTHVGLTGGSIGAGEICVFEVTSSVPADAAPGPHLYGTTALAGDFGVSGLAALGVLAVREAPPVRPSVTISASTDRTPAVRGRPLTYTIEVGNDGAVVAPGAVVTDVLATHEGASAETLVATSGCRNDPFTLACDLGDLAPGERRSFSLTVEVAGDAPGEIRHDVTVELSPPDGVPDGSVSVTTPVVAALAPSVRVRVRRVR